MGADLYKGKIPIIHSDLNDGWQRNFVPRSGDRFSMAAAATGLLPRDYSVDPVEMRDSPDRMQTVKQSEWDALYDKGEENEDSLEHIYLRGGKPAFEFCNQNPFPDCWCHSLVHAAMMSRAAQNLPPVRFNGVAMATMMGRTNGGWSGLAMKFARERGLPVVGTGPGQWPYRSRRGQETPALVAEMAKYKIVEDWYDLGRQPWDQKLSRDQYVTCLFNNMPTCADYNRHAHAMCSLRWVRVERGLWGSLTLNSWEGWGYHGLAVLVNHVPDDACALRSTIPTVAA